MVLPLLKHPKLTMLNKFSIFKHALPAQVLPLPMSSRDLNVLQTKASGDQNVSHYQNTIVEIEKWFMEATMFTKTPSPIIYDKKYRMVKDAWNQAIEAQNGNWH